MYPTKDCECEDFPCCEHADNYPAMSAEEASEAFYCDWCGYAHVDECRDGYED